VRRGEVSRGAAEFAEGEEEKRRREVLEEIRWVEIRAVKSLTRRRGNAEKRRGQEK